MYFCEGRSFWLTHLQHDMSHGPQEHTTFPEIWVPISHAKHCTVFSFRCYFHSVQTDANNFTAHTVELFVHIDVSQHHQRMTCTKDCLNPAQVQMILGTCHCIVIIFSENKGFYITLPLWSKCHIFFCTMYSLFVRLWWDDNKYRHSLCTFPNMVSNLNILKKSGIIRRKEEACCRQLLTMLGYWSHGLCAFPNMGINAYITRTSGEELVSME